jgi:hypothetical protein
MVNRELRSALSQIAAKHDLGSLVSLHRQERPLVRFRARWLWILLGGPAVGLLFALYNGDRGPYEPYRLYPDGAFLIPLAAVYLLGIALAGPIAARALPPPGPRRTVALYEDGLIELTEPVAEGDPVARPVRFDQVAHVDQQRESVGMVPQGMARSVTATSAAARLVADRDGQHLVLRFHGYRHQDRFVDAARTRLAGHPTVRSESTLRRDGRARFGNLLMTRKDVSVTDGVGLQPSEKPVLPWSDVERVNETDGGRLSIYRRGRPGERSGAADTAMLWFSGAVPDTSEAAAMIIRLRNKAMS